MGIRSAQYCDGAVDRINYRGETLTLRVKVNVCGKLKDYHFAVRGDIHQLAILDMMLETGTKVKFAIALTTDEGREISLLDFIGPYQGVVPYEYIHVM